METPKYYFLSSLHSDAWLSTRLVSDGKQYACGSPSDGLFCETAVVDSEYPGFSSAFNMLKNIGCDPREITSILKVCIEYHGEQSLDAFLVQAISLNTVKSALGLGLSGEEFVAALMLGAAAEVTPEPPQDMAFIQ